MGTFFLVAFIVAFVAFAGTTVTIFTQDYQLEGIGTGAAAIAGMVGFFMLIIALGEFGPLALIAILAMFTLGFAGPFGLQWINENDYHTKAQELGQNELNAILTRSLRWWYWLMLRKAFVWKRTLKYMREINKAMPEQGLDNLRIMVKKMVQHIIKKTLKRRADIRIARKRIRRERRRERGRRKKIAPEQIERIRRHYRELGRLEVDCNRRISEALVWLDRLSNQINAVQFTEVDFGDEVKTYERLLTWIDSFDSPTESKIEPGHIEAGLLDPRVQAELEALDPEPAIQRVAAKANGNPAASKLDRKQAGIKANAAQKASH